MSGKRFLCGLVVVGSISGMLADEALAFRGGRGGAGGGFGTRRTPSAPRNLSTRPSVPGRGNAISSPIRSGVPTLAPPQREFTPPNRRGATFDRPGNRQFRDRTNTPPSVWDHMGVDRPSDAPRPGTLNDGNWSPSPYRPFTPAWYVKHPGAWRMTHPNAGAAAVATSAAVAVWLGVGHVHIESSTTTVAESSDSEPTSTVPDTPPIADDAEWMPLGSFELKLSGQTVATRAVQLAVNRQGVIRGTYYDMAADSVKEVMGAVDKETLRASWTIGEAGQVVYEISLDSLSSPEGQLTVRYANGQTAIWRTSPMPQ